MGTTGARMVGVVVHSPTSLLHPCVGSLPKVCWAKKDV